MFVVGKSQWGGERIPTSDLLGEAASPWFDPVDELYYPITNRYMSYGRRNGANIDREYIVVLSRASTDRAPASA